MLERALCTCIAASFLAVALAANGQTDATADAVRALQAQMLADPEIMRSIEALRDDPAVQAILADPDIADALRRGNLGALLSNEKLGRLVERPAVQDITRQVVK